MKTVVGFLGLLLVAFGLGAPAADAATPSPTCSSPPQGFSFSATPRSVASGDQATLTVTYQTPCGTPQQHQFTITERADGNSEVTRVGHVTTEAQPTASASLEVHPTVSTTYYASEDGQTYSQLPSAHVSVDRQTGPCANSLVLHAPAIAPAGATVLVAGQTSDTSTVSILFRRRGHTDFAARREVQPASDGSFTTTFRADDDYRLYAATARCDSPALLVQVTPTLTGPATATRGAAVTVTVRTIAGQSIRLYFHRAGTTGYSLRRAGTTNASGVYTTTYVADADYRFYAATGPDGRRSNTGLTQLR